MRAESPNRGGITLTGFRMEVGQTVGDAASAGDQRTADAGTIRVHVTEGNILIGHAAVRVVAVENFAICVQQIFGIRPQRLGCDSLHLAKHFAAGFNDSIAAHEGQL